MRSTLNSMSSTKLLLLNGDFDGCTGERVFKVSIDLIALWPKITTIFAAPRSKAVRIG